MVTAANSGIVERTFTNKYGERWLLRIEPMSGDGNLLGDETDLVDGVKIRNDVVDPDYILADDEVEWLLMIWMELTGRELVLPVFNSVRRAALDANGPPSRR